MRIFMIGAVKLSRRLATWLTFAVLVGLVVLVLVAVGARAGQTTTPAERSGIDELLTFPGAYDALLSFIVGLGGLLAVIYGAAIAGSEWSWGTLKSAVARGESRSRYALATFGSVALFLAIGLLLAYAIAIGADVIAAKLAGISTSGLTDSSVLTAIPGRLARGWLAIVEEAALGYAVATLARSQLAGVGAGIALYFAESFATLLLPDVVKYLPFAAATESIATGQASVGGGAGAIVSRLDPNTALVAVCLWLVAALFVSAIFTERAEIGG